MGLIKNVLVIRKCVVVFFCVKDKEGHILIPIDYAINFASKPQTLIIFKNYSTQEIFIQMKCILTHHTKNDAK